MARKIKVVDYDMENDIFFVSDGSSVKASLDIGDFILDVNHDNLISGIEIHDASENLGISKKGLGGVKNVKLPINYKTDNVYVLMMIVGEREVNVQIPLSLNLGHKSPQKDMLVCA